MFLLFLGLLVSYYLAPTVFRVLLILACVVLFAMLATNFTILLFLSRYL